MKTPFKDRAEAGRLLAEALAGEAGTGDVMVLALPRGGVPVAAGVSAKWRLPLDVFVVRKLGMPGQPELAMGAIATGGVRVINREVVDSCGIPGGVVDAVTADEERELARRERAYRGDRPAPGVRGRTVIVVDDGIATGSTMLAAVAALRQQEAGRIVVASPVVARQVFAVIKKAADGMAALVVPETFHSVGQWYADFAQTTDGEVRRILAETGGRPGQRP